MEGKDHRGKKSPRDGQPSQDQGDQAGRADVEGEGDEMIADRRIAPKSVLNPKCAVQQRIILLSRTEFAPDAPETRPGAQRLPGHMSIVVPDQSTAERGKIGAERCAKNDRHRPPGLGTKPGRLGTGGAAGWCGEIALRHKNSFKTQNEQRGGVLARSKASQRAFPARAQARACCRDKADQCMEGTDWARSCSRPLRTSVSFGLIRTACSNSPIASGIRPSCMKRTPRLWWALA